MQDFESDSSSDEEDNLPKRNVNTSVKSKPSPKAQSVPSEDPDPDLKVANALKNYLGLSDEKPFLQKSTEEQAEIGHHLEHILRILCNGALVPLMTNTLTKQDISKIAALSNVCETGTGLTVKTEEDDDKIMARVDADMAKISNGVTNSSDESSSDDEKIISSEESEGEDIPEVSNQDLCKHNSVKRSV